ncbi:glycosyltransferase family 4 protein [Salipiger sp. IMCC34102]|uniref:glycosyltransferase n=1 Tax=Salipiger sp. IMCC34102 TaxID=2510647 RepID=UPI00101CD2A2|nr:glycosyltransferase [Salipiger sp. IMCC34102]RYH00768.1 glycosyltransferase family 4 protein [Salipiger sp. IMCC34102]
MRVAVLAHVRHPIAPPFMGGMEAHSYHLVKGLQARGHEVTLIASGDSEAGCPVIPLMDRHYDRDFPWHRFHGTPALTRHLDLAHGDVLPILTDGRFDVIHNNGLHRYPPRLARRDRVPMVTSLHVPPFDVLRRAVAQTAAPWSHFTTCSAQQQTRWWPDGAPAQAHVVPNGIDLADWPFVEKGDGTAVWAGRITPTKGAHLAVAAAQARGMELTLFGAIEHRDYFEDEVRPHLGDRIRYGGHLQGAELARRIGQASVLMFTPLWDEPFGLVAIEAMSCGVPVAAIDSGAVREVIGTAGAIAKTPDAGALAQAVEEALAIPRRSVRARVEAHFTTHRMIEGYETLYRAAMAGRDAAYPEATFAPYELPPRMPIREAGE